MMKQDAMLDALRKKKGQGIDLTIVLDGLDGVMDQDEDSEKLGLAPDTKEQTLGGDLGLEEKKEGMEVPDQTQVVDPAAHEDEDADPDRDLFRQLLEDAPDKTALGKLALAKRKK